MGFAQTMERKVFFNIIRWFAFIVTFIGFVAMIIGVFLFITNFKNIFPTSSVNVTYQEVQGVVAAKETDPSVYNEKAKFDIKNAYTASQTFFRNYPMDVISPTAMTNTGYSHTEGVQIIIHNGSATALSISTKHDRGDVTYRIDASGKITEEKDPSSAINKKVQTDSSSPDSSKDQKQIESLVKEIVNQFPADKIMIDKAIAYFSSEARSYKEEYQLRYLKGLLLTLKSIPPDKKTDFEKLTSFATEYTALFKKKVNEAELNKQLNEMQGMKNFAIYAWKRQPKIDHCDHLILTTPEPCL